MAFREILKNHVCVYLHASTFVFFLTALNKQINIKERLYMSAIGGVALYWMPCLFKHIMQCPALKI
jgi:hypothetical protein